MLHLIIPGLYGYIGHLGKEKGIAAFDLGDTIISKMDDYWYFLPNRISILKKYQEAGYTLVIFANSRKEVIPYINNMISVLKDNNIYPWVFVSTGKNIYHKPNIGMWNIFLHYYKEYIKYFDIRGHSLDISLSFFVGNKAGRSNDRGNTDRDFANNIGMPFYTPEDIFI